MPAGFGAALAEGFVTARCGVEAAFGAPPSLTGVAEFSATGVTLATDTAALALGGEFAELEPETAAAIVPPAVGRAREHASVRTTSDVSA